MTETERTEKLTAVLAQASPEDTARIRFVLEMDKMKTIYRHSLLLDQSRTETDAEHSWQLAMMALVLAPHAEPGTDMLKVLKMCLIHDVVEIDAGDTYAYDKNGNGSKAAREASAAERIYAILPGEEGLELKALWEEFDRVESREAIFANALDRLQPMLLHVYTDGTSWRENKVELEDVLERAEPIKRGLPQLWPMMEKLLKTSFELGLLL